MLGFSNFIQESYQVLLEKLITFNKKAYPKFGTIVIMAGGAGCHAKGTEILMFDGSLKKVEDISVNDLLMGPDSKPRKVLNLHRGKENMIEVRVKGREPFRVNRSHIHSFVASYDKNGLEKGKIYNLTFDEYMALTPTKRSALKLYSSNAIEFVKKQLPVAPYVVGYWLGDGIRSNTNVIVENKNKELVVSEFSKKLGDGYEIRDVKSDHVNCSVISITTGRNRNENVVRQYLTNECFSNGEKYIPEIYLTSSINQRKELLAGLIDSDGYNGGKYYEIVTCFPKLKDGIVRLAQSLGYHVNVSKKKTPYNGEIRNYDRITISGSFEDLSVIMKHKKCEKREQIKNVNHYGAIFKECRPENYYGFEVDGDNLYVMGNYMVTHNSGKGFIKNGLVGVEGFNFDVDELKTLASKTPAIYKRVKDELGIDLKKLSGDLKDPKNVSKLHEIIGDFLMLDSKKKETIFRSAMLAHPDRKPNLIFDITMKDLRQLQKITDGAKLIGYDPKNIHIVWVINDIEVAKTQNAMRSRTVPAEILLNTHRGVSQTMRDILEMGNKIKSYLDGDIVFAFNKIKVDSELVKSGKGGSYIKEANFFYVKRAGQSIMSYDQISKDIRAKIASYVPKNVEWN